MTVRTALRTSSNRAAVRVLETVGMRQTMTYVNRLNFGQMPARAVDRAGRRRSDAAVADRRPTPRSPTAARWSSRSSSAASRIARATCSPTRSRSCRAPSRETTAFLMANMLADVVNAGTGVSRARRRVQPARGRQDRHDQRLRGRVVRRLHAAAGRRASGSASISRRRSSSSGYGGELAVPVWGEFMKVGDEGRQGRLAEAPVERRRRRHLPHVGQAAGRRAAGTSRW